MSDGAAGSDFLYDPHAGLSPLTQHMPAVLLVGMASREAAWAAADTAVALLTAGTD